MPRSRAKRVCATASKQVRTGVSCGIARNVSTSPTAQALARAAIVPRSASSRSSTWRRHSTSSSSSALNALIAARGSWILTLTWVSILAMPCRLIDLDTTLPIWPESLSLRLSSASRYSSPAANSGRHFSTLPLRPMYLALSTDQRA